MVIKTYYILLFINISAKHTLLNNMTILFWTVLIMTNQAKKNAYRAKTKKVIRIWEQWL